MGLFNVEAALLEVQQKSDAEMDRDTAGTWASRAMACFRLSKSAARAGNPDDAVTYLVRAEKFAHEAVEHAGSVGDDGATLRLVEHAIDNERYA